MAPAGSGEASIGSGGGRREGSTRQLGLHARLLAFCSRVPSDANLHYIMDNPAIFFIFISSTSFAGAPFLSLDDVKKSVYFTCTSSIRDALMKMCRWAFR